MGDSKGHKLDAHTLDCVYRKSAGEFDCSCDGSFVYTPPSPVDEFEMALNEYADTIATVARVNKDGPRIAGIRIGARWARQHTLTSEPVTALVEALKRIQVSRFEDDGVIATKALAEFEKARGGT